MIQVRTSACPPTQTVLNSAVVLPTSWKCSFLLLVVQNISLMRIISSKLLNPRCMPATSYLAAVQNCVAQGLFLLVFPSTNGCFICPLLFAGAGASSGRGHLGACVLHPVQEPAPRVPEEHLEDHQLEGCGRAPASSQGLSNSGPQVSPLKKTLEMDEGIGSHGLLGNVHREDGLS